MRFFYPVPRSVAIAFGGVLSLGPSFFDIETFESTMYRSRPWVNSEIMCIQYLKENNNTVLCGHRDGSLSVLDKRSGDMFNTGKMENSGRLLGSITNILPLRNDLVLVKGSFGSSRLLDVRCLKNRRMGDASNNDQALLAELTAPGEVVHEMLSTRCVGCAVDPTERMTIAPFVSKQNELIFGLWCNITGRYIRGIEMDCENLIKDIVPYTDMGTGTAITAARSVFCELSATITPAFSMHTAHRDEEPRVMATKGSWGLWFKTGSLSTPVSGGGIHHITFPGSV